MNTWKQSFSEAKQYLFKQLKDDESMTLAFEGEETEFIRLNQTKVRQISHVDQGVLTVNLIQGKKHVSMKVDLSKNLKAEKLQMTLDTLRAEISHTEDDEFFTPLEVNEQSETDHQSDQIPTEEFLKHLSEYQNEDMAGYLAKGEIYRGLCDSKNVDHWYHTSTFNFDYSFYSAKQKAVKDNYTGIKFNPELFHQKIQHSLESLAMLQKEAKVLEPGKYRVYLSPSAVNEILGTWSWRGFSQRALEQKQSPMIQLINGEKSFSEKFTIAEDFSLSLAPQYNDKGQMKPKRLELISKGQLQNLLACQETANEYGGESNSANKSEFPSSLKIEKGSLKQEEILAKLGTGLYISNLHYINWSDIQKGRMTGMTRFGCLWVENGIVQGPIKDLRFDETIYQIFGEGLEEFTNFSETFMESGTYEQRHLGGVDVPGALVRDFSFTL